MNLEWPLPLPAREDLRSATIYVVGDAGGQACGVTHARWMAVLMGRMVLDSNLCLQYTPAVSKAAALHLSEGFRAQHAGITQILMWACQHTLSQWTSVTRNYHRPNYTLVADDEAVQGGARRVTPAGPLTAENFLRKLQEDCINWEMSCSVA